jgi:hypothetical protein
MEEAKELEFIIVQKAKSKGGDKYVCVSNPDFSIYFPQSVSRDPTSENVHQKLAVTVKVIKE